MNVGPVTWSVVAGGEPTGEELAGLVVALLPRPAPPTGDGRRPGDGVPEDEAWGRAGRLEAVTGQVVTTRSGLAALERTVTRR